MYIDTLNRYPPSTSQFSISTRLTSRSILGRHLTNSRSIVGRVSTDSWIDQKLVDSRPTFDRDFNGVSMECHPRCPRSSIDREDWLTISIGNSTADALSTHDPMRPTTATFWNPNLLGASLLKMPSCLEVQLSYLSRRQLKIFMARLWPFQRGSTV